jgi:monoamine oxidase
VYTRRLFLTLAAAAAAMPRHAAAARTRVIVVGAGLAGLTAAREAQARGADVIVLEARDRIGGRIETSSRWPGLPVDLGASWIHGLRRNPMTALARQAGARLVQTSYDASIMIGPEGDVIDPSLRRARRILNAALRAARRGPRDISVWQAVRRSRGWAGANADVRRLVAHLVNATYEQEYSGPADSISAWWGDDGDVFGGPDALFPGGFSQVTEALAEGLDIRLGHVVGEVAPGRVSLVDGRRFPADKIVLTLPLGVLRAGDVRFVEPLEASRNEAIETLRMGLLDKTWLRFDRIAWPDDVDWIEWLGPKPGFWAEWVSLANGLGEPVLLGFNAGNEAAAIEALDNRATVASATAALRSMFGNAFPAPVAAQVTRWGRERFTRGSYSYNAVGVTGRTRDDLAGSDWDGALWFAGEACSRSYYGTTHGAVLSARAAVRQMLDTENRHRALPAGSAG